MTARWIPEAPAFSERASRLLLMLGGLLVASGLLMAYQRSLGMIGFLLAGIIGLWMIATIFIQDRRSRKRKGKS